jgi:Flp pilus assembly protein TadB
MAQVSVVSDLDDRPIGDLLRLLAEQASTLARQEFDLAKSELQEKQQEAQPAIRTAVWAAIFGVIALSALTTLIIFGLSYLMPEWLAAVIILVIAGVVAAILAGSARRRLQQLGTMPTETVETLREDLEWAKSQRTFVGR